MRLRALFACSTDAPVDKYDQEKTQDGMFAAFVESLVESKVLKYTTKVDSDGFMSIDFELTASKLE